MSHSEESRPYHTDCLQDQFQWTVFMVIAKKLFLENVIRHYKKKEYKIFTVQDIKLVECIILFLAFFSHVCQHSLSPKKALENKIKVILLV